MQVGKTSGTSVLAQLAGPLLKHILSFLDGRALGRCTRVCWSFFVLANNEEHWRYLVLLDFIDRTDRSKQHKELGTPWYPSEKKVANFCFKGSWKLTYIIPQRQTIATEDGQEVLLPWRSQNLRRIQALRCCKEGLHARWLGCPSAINFLTIRGELLAPPSYAVRLVPSKRQYEWYNLIGIDLEREAAASPSSLLPVVGNIDDGISIARRHCSTLSRKEFVEQFEVPNRPVLITGLMDSWPAMEKWKLDNFVQQYRDVPLKTNGRCSKGRRFRLRCFDFLAYCDGWNGEKPLYVFDKKLVMDVCPEITKDYTVPEYFTPSDDLFELMDEGDRPDYRWLLLGPNGSGSPFHQDPHGSSAWNAVIEGVKRVSFYPPDYIPPGIDEDLIDSDYYAGDDTVEWYRNRMPRLLKKGHSNTEADFEREASIRRSLNSAKDKRERSALNDRPPIEVTVRRGEVLFIPSGWWHQVQNWGHTIAVTQNFCSTITFPRVAEDMNRYAGRTIRKDFHKALLTSEKYCHLASSIRLGPKIRRQRDSSSDSSSSGSSDSSDTTTDETTSSESSSGSSESE